LVWPRVRICNKILVSGSNIRHAVSSSPVICWHTMDQIVDLANNEHESGKGKITKATDFFPFSLLFMRIFTTLQNICIQSTMKNLLLFVLLLIAVHGCNPDRSAKPTISSHKVTK